MLQKQEPVVEAKDAKKVAPVIDPKTGKTDDMATKVKEDETRAAEREENKKKWNTAWDALKTQGEKIAEVKEALMVLRPSLYGIGHSGGGQRNTVKYSFLDMVKTAPMHEDDAFKNFKMGRKEIADFIKWRLKTVEPKDRQWISFNAETGLYKTEGFGENPPKDWKGYVPPKNEVNEFAKQI